MNGHKWVRIHDSKDLDVNNAINREKNKNRMEDPTFKSMCDKCGVLPTKRQASKYNNKRGIVYRTFCLKGM